MIADGDFFIDFIIPHLTKLYSKEIPSAILDDDEEGMFMTVKTWYIWSEPNDSCCQTK